MRSKAGVFLRGLLVMVIVGVLLAPLACQAKPTPTPTPIPTPTPTPKADPEREAIITFTRQALAIEAGRDELLNLRERYPITLIASLREGDNRHTAVEGFTWCSQIESSISFT